MYELTCGLGGSSSGQPALACFLADRGTGGRPGEPGSSGLESGGSGLASGL